MNRSTLRSLTAVFATVIVSLSVSPVAASAQTAPATDRVRTLDIGYGDGDEGAIYVGPVTVTPQPTAVVLAPGDVLFGDDDQAIAIGPVLVTAASPAEFGDKQAAPDVVFTDNDEGGMPVDLSAFRGRSNISAAELASGQPVIAQTIADEAQQFVDDE
jgi:hypothetical protein